MTKRPLIIFWTLIGLGVVIRLATITASGTSDMNVFTNWATYTLAHPVSGIYGIPYYADYAPGSIYFLAASAKLFSLFNSGLQNPLIQHATANLFPVILSGLTTAALFMFTRRHFGVAWARVVSLAFWLNPAILLHTPLLGYQDMNFLFFDVVALVFLFNRRYALAVAFMFSAGFVKQPGFLIAPIVAYTIIRETKLRDWFGYVGIAIIVTLLFYLPFMDSRAHMNEAYGGLQRLLGQQFLSGNGPNIWWLATGYIEHHTCLTCPSSFLTEPITKLRYITLDDFSAFFHVSAKYIAYLLLGAFSVGNLWILHRSLVANRWAIFFTAGLQVFIYQLLATAVHENHLVYFFPFFVFLLPLGRIYRVIYTVTSILFFSSLFVFYGFGRDWALPFVTIRTFLGIDTTLILAALNLILFGILTLTALRFITSHRSAKPKL